MYNIEKFISYWG